MTTKIEIAVVLTTYERPTHLFHSLTSLAFQRGVDGKFEVIVADDGSADNTRAMVRKFARTAKFPVRLTTHAHEGFRVALCRNDGVRASTAPYLLFTDGDCIFPPDHLQQHLRARKPKVARAGSCFRLDRDATHRLDEAAIASEAYRSWISPSEGRRLRLMRIKDQWYNFIRHPLKPKLTGWNIGISRDDLESVNGFDESFVGWGCEDDDLAYRLRKVGVRVASALRYTSAYHMWHPVHATRPVKWTDGLNVQRLKHARPVQCRNGITTILQFSAHSCEQARSGQPSQQSRRVA